MSWTQELEDDDGVAVDGSPDWIEQSSRANLLNLTADDFQGLSTRGSPAQWHPLLIPLRSEMILSDRDFVLGLPNAIGNIEDLAPEVGQCAAITQNFNPGQTESVDHFSLINIKLLTPEGSPQTGTHGQLFFIHDQTSRAVRAIGFFNDDGQAECRIRKGQWYVSTGFGEARVHKLFSSAPGGANKVNIRHHKRALLRIRTGRETGLQYGDLLRIGRIRTQQSTPQELNQLPDVPFQVPEDLFRPVLSPSENFGVREYLATSLILQRREFSISLEPGEYMIGVWRRGHMYRCAEKLLINETENALLACHPQMEAARLSESIQSSNKTPEIESKKISTLVFDASFMPSRLIGQNTFRSWMAKNGTTRMLRAGRAIDSHQQQIQFLLQPLMQNFSGTSFDQPEGPYVGDFRLTQRPDTDPKMGKSAFVRLLTAQSGLSIEAILARFFSSSHFVQSIPMAGTTERGLLEGVVPLTFRTVLKSTESRIFRTEGAETFVTNGALIDWIDPLPALSGAPLKLGPQQHVRLKLTIPPEDTTENLGMYINGVRVKQWTINPELNKNSYRTLEIEEKITLQNDFLLGFASWGQSYLPEFMFGIRQLPALSFTRIYCIDVNENNICDRQ